MKKVAVGVDIGGTNSAYGLVDEQGNILSEGVFPTRNFPDSDLYIEELYIGIQNLLKTAGEEYELIGVGIGAPNGNFYKGTIEFAPNLPWKGTVNLVEKMKRFFPTLPVIVTNDANAAAWGEYRAGVGRGCSSMVMVTLGTGVGGGIIEDSRIVTGCNWAAGELGHFVIDMNGEPCNCGLRGCFEQYGSVTALIAQTRAAMRAAPDSLLWEQAGGSEQLVNGRTAFDAMRRGDASAKAVVDGYVHYLCVGITSIVNIFQPEVLCVGGGISREGEAVMAPVRAYVGKYGYARGSAKQPRIVAASLAGDAGIIGAALLGTEKK